MKAFRRALDERAVDSADRRWLFVPYDQLDGTIGPLASEDPSELGIVLVESRWKAAQRPYHKQKLALVLSNLRHFALEQAERGVAVRHIATDGPYRDALAPLIDDVGPLRVREPAEWELRTDLAPLIADGGIEVIPHGGWLTTVEQFEASQKKGPPWRMDAFYRHVRRESGVLMAEGSPVGGKYSFDAENRKRWSGEPAAPEPPEFSVDEIKAEVLELIESTFADHPGVLRPAHVPGTLDDAEALWTWAKDECMEQFGPYEDAMSTRSTGLFHTRISALLNLGRLNAEAVLNDVLALDIPLSSKEGFVRQLLGWREFVRHVHTQTEGFRALPEDAGTPPEGFEAAHAHGGETDPADPSHLGARNELPAAFWGTPSGLGCLDRVVGDVIEEGYSHHITRLMVLSNIAALLDVRPREITDWFWAMYTDAYDWVVEPNVLAMGTYAVGDLMTTKPYVSGSNYIDRMSDYCDSCRFDPGSTCPIRRLYWAYLGRHAETLSGNRRLSLPLASLRKRAEDERAEDAKTFERVLRTLASGAELEPPTAAQDG